MMTDQTNIRTPIIAGSVDPTDDRMFADVVAVDGEIVAWLASRRGARRRRVHQVAAIADGAASA